jgi:hypothetical protein
MREGCRKQIKAHFLFLGLQPHSGFLDRSHIADPVAGHTGGLGSQFVLSVGRNLAKSRRVRHAHGRRPGCARRGTYARVLKSNCGIAAVYKNVCQALNRKVPEYWEILGTTGSNERLGQ